MQSNYSAHSSGSAPRLRPRPRYVDEGRRLLALLTDGAERGYHVQGTFSVLERGTYRPVRGTLVTSHWEPARFREGDVEEFRPLTAHAVAAHLRGDYWVGVAPPSWTSWFALDIDRPEPAVPGDAEAERRADLVRDEMLAAVWRAFSFDEERQPVLLSTPGGGYHVYAPLCRSAGSTERTWPAAWIRERVEHRLSQAGLFLREGRLELWPCGKVLRFPCGRGMALLAPRNPNHADDLCLEPLFARWLEREDPVTKQRTPSLRRDVAATVHAFLDAFEARRRPLDEWLETSEAAWSKPWGPWGDRGIPAVADDGERVDPKNQGSASRAKDCLLQQSVEGSEGVDGALVGPGGDWLLHGKVFVRYISRLLEKGMVEPGRRHDAALKLVYYFGVHLRWEEAESLAALESWLRRFPHDSRLLSRVGKEKFIKQTIREGRHYFRGVVVPARRVKRGRGFDLGVIPLADQDETAFSGRFSSRVVERAARSILRFVRGHATGEGRVPQPVELSGTLLATLCGETRVVTIGPDGEAVRSRAYKLAMTELEALGVLSVHRNYKVGGHGRRYCCWYVFGSGALPSCDESGRFVLAERQVEEGVLRVLGRADRHLRAEVELAAGDDAPAWVERMYRRRDFTPAEFLEGDARKLIPGPFRHVYSQTKADAPGEHTRRHRGRVVSFGDAKGFGFIRPHEGGPDVFFHQSQLVAEGFRTVVVGASVSYTLAIGKRGRFALWVEPFSDSQLPDVSLQTSDAKRQTSDAKRPGEDAGPQLSAVLPDEFVDLELDPDLAAVIAEAWETFRSVRKLE